MTYKRGADRYHSKRAAGISGTRFDGTKYDPETDYQAAAAEEFAADSLGCKFNAEVNLSGDGGFDFEFTLQVEVYWLGKVGNEPRRSGHLIINPLEPHRHADIYVVVRGSVEDGFSVVGWTTHRVLTRLKKDFGYGERYCVHTDNLWPIDKLKGLKRGQ